MTLTSFSRLTIVSLALMAPCASIAAPATPEEAQRLVTLFQRYIGTPSDAQKGGLTITPQGESYKVDIDVARFFGPLAGFGVTIAKTGDEVVVLTPQADGTWHVTSDGLPALAITDGEQTTTLSYEGFKFDGLFDPKLSTFKTVTSTMTGVSAGALAPHVSDQTDVKGRSETRQTAEDAGDGSVNVTIHQTVNDLDYKATVTIPSSNPDPPSTPVTFEAKAASASTDLSASHLFVAKILDVWAFLVAHPSKAQIVDGQIELKGLLQAILATNPAGSWESGVHTLGVTTPQGKFELADASERFTVGGGSGQDEIAFSGKGSGLTIPAELIPAWAAGLVPTALDYGVTVGPVHINTALRKAVADMDLANDKPLTEDQNNEVVQAFGQLDAIGVTLAPTTITTDLMTVKATGSAHMGLGGGPVGTLTVMASGLDKALASLSGQSAPEATQALTFLASMKQLATPLPDGSYLWKVDAPVGGAITINGAPLTAAAPATAPKRKKKPSPANP